MIIFVRPPPVPSIPLQVLLLPLIDNNNNNAIVNTRETVLKVADEDAPWNDVRAFIIVTNKMEQQQCREATIPVMVVVQNVTTGEVSETTIVLPLLLLLIVVVPTLEVVDGEATTTTTAAATTATARVRCRPTLAGHRRTRPTRLAADARILQDRRDRRIRIARRLLHCRRVVLLLTDAATDEVAETMIVSVVEETKVTAKAINNMKNWNENSSNKEKFNNPKTTPTEARRLLLRQHLLP